MDNIIFPAIKHIRDVIAFGHDYLGEEPTHWNDGKYFEKEIDKLKPLIDQGAITWPIERPSQSYEVHKMCLSLYGALNEDMTPPELDSDEWGDIFIYQYDDASDQAWGRAQVGYYETFKHYNIQLNEARLRENGDVNIWAGVIYHEMMHNWGWGHDEDLADRSEYIYHAQEVVVDLVPA